MDDDRFDEQPTGVRPGDPDAQPRSLEARLMAARTREQDRASSPASGGADANYRAGSRVLGDLLGGIMGGLFLGWVIDQFAGTRPWGLIVMLFLGIFVAFRNIVRTSGQTKG